MRARVAAALAVALGLAGCGGTSTSTPTSSASPPGAATTTWPHHRRAPHHAPRPRPVAAPAPGTLPQTTQEPIATTPGFQAEMRGLWQGIRSGSPTVARAGFFPEAAYLQLKTLGDPAGDFTGRLLADFDADVLAAHALLGSSASQARLVAVDVPASYAHWVPPGVCDNGVGYWEVPNSRVVYSEGGVVRSFGIASMISWRGVWYVVHLGAILRSSAGGVVDDPAEGPGTAVASSTC